MTRVVSQWDTQYLHWLPFYSSWIFSAEDLANSWLTLCSFKLNRSASGTLSSAMTVQWEKKATGFMNWCPTSFLLSFRTKTAKDLKHLLQKAMRRLFTVRTVTLTLAAGLDEDNVMMHHHWNGSLQETPLVKPGNSLSTCVCHFDNQGLFFLQPWLHTLPIEMRVWKVIATDHSMLCICRKGTKVYVKLLASTNQLEFLEIDNASLGHGEFALPYTIQLASVDIILHHNIL